MKNWLRAAVLSFPILAVSSADCTYLDKPEEFLRTPEQHWREISGWTEQVTAMKEPTPVRRGVDLPDGTPAPLPAPPGPPAREPEGAGSQPQATGGFLVAWDPVKQQERWRLLGPGGTNGGGGTLATAGNLVFHGPIAYNAATGEKLWETDLGGNNVTPITYMLDGKQYVTLFARAYPDNRLFTFVLDGKGAVPPKSTPTPVSPR